ncbi:SIS domain-containing protein [Streptomyces avermitilis]|uniref:SIS domain-containing protein n=1 Tax=Streptomyces avermitilis TaxID=33903 RepID=UPI0033ADF65C
MTSRTYTLEEVDRQIRALPSDLPTLAPAARAGAAGAARTLGDARHLTLLGSGDSLYAAQAALPVFVAGGVGAQAMSATEFLRRATRARPDELTAVVGISASGGNPSVLAAVAAARRSGRPTVAVTGTPAGALASACDAAVVVDPGPSAPAPGIRTYQASLLALLHLAHAVAGTDGPAELDAVAEAQRRSTALARAAAPAVARLLAPTPVVHVVAEASVLPTARFLGAKLSETAGVPALVAELEDWWHVHRFGHQARHPVLFLIPPGPDRDAALECARRTAARRPLVVVADAADGEALALGAATVPLTGAVPEALRPLADSVVAGPVAMALARELGRLPFAYQ